MAMDFLFGVIRKIGMLAFAGLAVSFFIYTTGKRKV
jgi:hypothetical protein